MQTLFTFFFPSKDILSVESEDTFSRPMYAGNAIATVKSKDDVKVATVRTTAFEKASPEGGSASVDAVSADGDAGLSTWKSDELSQVGGLFSESVPSPALFPSLFLASSVLSL